MSRPCPAPSRTRKAPSWWPVTTRSSDSGSSARQPDGDRRAPSAAGVIGVQDARFTSQNLTKRSVAAVTKTRLRRRNARP